MNIKSFLTALFCLTAMLSIAQSPIIKATSKKVSIKDGPKFSRDSWTLSPEYNPDVYTTTATGKKKITFYTDLDSISFTVQPGKAYNFVIVLNAKDSCKTQIKVLKEVKAANFSKAYIRKNKGQFNFEIPEVQELVHIIIALTPRGIADNNMVNHESGYYKEVMEHFGPYKTDTIIAEFEKMIKGNYSHVKMDACGFYFEGTTIKKDKVYDRLNWSSKNFIEPYVKELQEFAERTGFRAFYKAHQPYYTSLIQLINTQIPIQQQWSWLEKNFPLKYDNYRITFSPLANGAHSTNHFETGDFKQTVMFISGPIEKPVVNEKVTEGLMTRVVFTEIDHNYVNPISDQYLAAIDNAFANREIWAKKGGPADSYSSLYSVFNEYMTWAVFTLYASEHYNAEDFKLINEDVEKRMTGVRGFSNFKKFNEKMLELYRNKPKTAGIATLYPAILEWSLGN